MKETLATFTIQILGSENPDKDKRVLADLPAMLEAVEEDLTDLLPEEYEASIKEWNEE